MLKILLTAEKSEELAVKAIDDHTFSSAVSQPVPYVVELVTHSSLLPVHKASVEKHGDAWVKKNQSGWKQGL